MIIKFPRWRRRLGFRSQPTRWTDGKKRRGWHWRNTITPAVIGLLLGLAVFVGFSGNGVSNAQGIPVRVIDGDTVENTATGERIRLPNIDTPETGDRAQCPAEAQAGASATRAAREIVSGATVTVRPTGRTDRYGRTIGFVIVDGRDLGEIMMERGLARPWRGRREPWCATDGSLLP